VKKDDEKALGRGSRRPASSWVLKRPLGARSLLLIVGATILLGVSARRTEIDRMVGLCIGYAAHVVGLNKESTIARGVDRFVSTWLPPTLSEETPISRIDGFDRSHLPLFSHVESRETSSTVYDYEQKKAIAKTEIQEVLVRPMGYLFFVCGKMLESLEIALWGTLLGLFIGAPIAYFSARGYAPHTFLLVVARAVAGGLRAIPEIVSVLFLVLAFGVGPMAGVLALGLHSAGFFGKFFADDIENTDRGPQEALAGLGANRIKVLWFAALPQALPQFASYTQYILERNVRMAAVIGVVGAGGIGIELKGRFDMYDFSHVTTIVCVVLVTVLALERLAQWLRARLI
jgi:phosphonate transport system permease protein